jgi:hypothetical protein
MERLRSFLGGVAGRDAFLRAGADEKNCLATSYNTLDGKTKGF